MNEHHPYTAVSSHYDEIYQKSHEEATKWMQEKVSLFLNTQTIIKPEDLFLEAARINSRSYWMKKKNIWESRLNLQVNKMQSECKFSEALHKG